MKKYFFLSLLVIIFVVVKVMQQWPDDNLHLIICDVGQGDAILLTHGFWQMLIDAGPDDKVLDCLYNNIPFWDKKIEQIVVTHMDYDHIGGMEAVLDAFFLKNLWLSDKKTSKTAQNLLKDLDNEQLMGTGIQTPFLGSLVSSNSQLVLTVLWPQSIAEFSHKPIFWQKGELKNEKTETKLSDEVQQQIIATEDHNARSIVLYLEFGKFDALLTGDAPIATELALVNQHLIQPINALKVGHHGAKTSTSTQFLKNSKPELSLISCGLNNQYDHPDVEVVSNLEEWSGRLLRTDLQGSVELVTDGEKYWLFVDENNSQ